MFGFGGFELSLWQYFVLLQRERGKFTPNQATSKKLLWQASSDEGSVASSSQCVHWIVSALPQEPENTISDLTGHGWGDETFCCSIDLENSLILRDLSVGISLLIEGNCTERTFKQRCSSKSIPRSGDVVAVARSVKDYHGVELHISSWPQSLKTFLGARSQLWFLSSSC